MSKIYIVVEIETIGYSSYFGSVTYCKGMYAFKSKDKAEECIRDLELSLNYKNDIIFYDLWELDVIE